MNEFATDDQPSCLYIDQAYTVSELLQRQHRQFFDARHSGGFFKKVIGLHPFADRVQKMAAPVEEIRFSERQVVVEAKAMAWNLPRVLAPIDLILTQAVLLRRIARLIRAENLSLISATDPLYSGLFGYWLKRLTGRPLVVHIYGNFELNYRNTGRTSYPKLFPWRWLEHALFRYVLRRADKVAAGSHTVAEQAEQCGVPTERIFVLRVGKHMVPEHSVPPLERARLTDDERRRLGSPSNGKLLLTIARLEPDKLVGDALRAFAIVAEHVPDAMLVIAGQGTELKRLQALASTLGLAERVNFLGLMGQSVLTRLAPECVILSPLTGIALLETSMSGAPPVAYDIDSSIADLVESDVTGFLIEQGNWRAMGQAALRIIQDPALRQRLSIAVRSRAEALTDLGTIVAAEEAAYRPLIANG